MYVFYSFHSGPEIESLRVALFNKPSTLGVDSANLFEIIDHDLAGGMADMHLPAHILYNYISLTAFKKHFPRKIVQFSFLYPRVNSRALPVLAKCQQRIEREYHNDTTSMTIEEVSID